MASIFDKFHPHLPKAIAGAIGVGVGAALMALLPHMSPDIATLIGQAVSSFLGG